MRKVKFYLGIGYSMGNREEIMEFEDGTTDEEISETYEEWKNNYLDGTWWDVEDE